MKVFLSCLLVTIAGQTVNAERYDGTSTVSGSMKFLLNDEFMSFKITGDTTVDLTINEETAEIFYHEYRCENIVVSGSQTETFLVPGTFDTVDITTEIALGPFEVTARNVGPLALEYVSPGHFAVESNYFGDKEGGGFNLPTISGQVVVAGATDSLSTLVATQIGRDSKDCQFPVNTIDVTDFPASVDLLGYSCNLTYFASHPIFQSQSVDGLSLSLVETGFNLRFQNHQILVLSPEPAAATLVFLALASSIVFGARRFRKRWC